MRGKCPGENALEKMKSELGKSSRDGSHPRLLSADGRVLFQRNQRGEDALKIQGCGAYGKNHSSWPRPPSLEGEPLPSVLQITPRGSRPAERGLGARLSPDSRKHGPNVHLQSQLSRPRSHISVEIVSYFKSSCLKWLVLLYRLDFHYSLGLGSSPPKK